MFDPRAPLLTTIQGIGQAYVDQNVFDYESTERSLAQLEKPMFSGAAVLLGDERQKTDFHSKGYNRVTTEVDLLVCAKSTPAKAALQNIISELSVGLNNSKLGESFCLGTQILSASEVKRHQEKDTVHYITLTVEIKALEVTEFYQGLFTVPAFNLPTLQITRPSAVLPNYAVSTGSPGSIEVEATFTAGDYDVSQIYYFLIPSTTTNSLSSLPQLSLITPPTDSFTFSSITPSKLNISSSGTYNFTIYVFLFDSAGASVIATKNITITVT